MKLIKYEVLLCFITALKAFIKRTDCKIKHSLQVTHEAPVLLHILPLQTLDSLLTALEEEKIPTEVTDCRDRLVAAPVRGQQNQSEVSRTSKRTGEPVRGQQNQ